MHDNHYSTRLLFPLRTNLLILGCKSKSFILLFARLGESTKKVVEVGKQSRIKLIVDS